MFKHFHKHSEMFVLNNFSLLYFPRKKVGLISLPCSVCMCYVNVFNHLTKSYIIFPALGNNNMENAWNNEPETDLVLLIPRFSHDV